jgi:hypothetical protein
MRWTRAGTARLVTLVVGLGVAAGCGGGGSGDAGRTTVAFCTQSRKLQGQLQGTQQPSDPNALLAAIEAYRALDKVAPDEIRGDVTRVLDALQAYQGGDTRKLSGGEVETASAHLRTFGKTKCGINPS